MAVFMNYFDDEKEFTNQMNLQRRIYISIKLNVIDLQKDLLRSLILKSRTILTKHT